MATALVTGGNRGLGYEVARQLVQRDWRVLVAARDPAKAGMAARTLDRGSGRVAPVVLDVTSPGLLRGATVAVQTQLRDWGASRLDAVVSNAGVALTGFDAGVVEQTLAVNFRGSVDVVEAFLPLLAPAACVVLVSSGMGEISGYPPELRERFLDPDLSLPGLIRLVEEYAQAVRDGTYVHEGWPTSGYRVSKTALNMYARLRGAELRDRLHINAVCPGWVRTDMGGSSAPRSVQDGAAGIVWAATLDRKGPTGGFFRDGRRLPW